MIAAIDKLNADKKVHINTILLNAERSDEASDDAKAGAECMKTIADKNGGQFAEMSVEDF